MDNQVTEVKRLLISRFGSNIFLLRLAGIPFKMKKISTLYGIYMVTVIFCTCTTFGAMLCDVYVHRDDLEHVMTNIRVSIPCMNILWIYFYCR